MPTTKRKSTAFHRLQKAKKSHCAGRSTKAAVRKAATAYIKDAVKKGTKTKTEATKSANRVLKAGCSTGIGKKKKVSHKVTHKVKHVIGRKKAATRHHRKSHKK